MQALRPLHTLTSRSELIEFVKECAPWAEGEASPISGTQEAMDSLIGRLDPAGYGLSRNFGSGSVSRLSPFVRHGCLSLFRLKQLASQRVKEKEEAQKFIQELAWRDFWQRIAHIKPEWLWQDIEPYKTGWKPEDYNSEMPADILQGETELACLNEFIKTLLSTGYLHNHARMYLASYVVHFRRVKWQVGASWFLEHLLDGDEASNNLSWQWIASTFSQKPYIFNLENVRRFFGGSVNTSSENNQTIDLSYELLDKKLFPFRKARV